MNCPKKRFPWLALVLLALTLVAATGAGADVRVYRALDAAAYRPSAATLSSLPDAQLMMGFSDSQGKPAKVQTRAAAFADADALHFVVECLEPDMARTLAKCTDHEGDVFSDECVELFVSPKRSPTHYFHLVANALGTRFDEKVKDRTWDPEWKTRVVKGGDRWTLEVSIPFAEIGGRPAPGDVWWFNVDRQRHEGDALQLSSWSPAGSDFHDTTQFAAMVFDDRYGAYLEKSVVKPFDQQAATMLERATVAPEAARTLQASLDAIRAELAPVRAAASAATAPACDEFGRLLGVGHVALAKLADAGSVVEDTIARAETALAMRGLARPGQSLLAYEVRAITNRQILPWPEPPDEASRVLSMQACRGEYEPASFVAYSLDDTVRLEVKVSDLKRPAGVIPADAVDVRAVKCWYQSGKSGRFPINKGLRALTPELLLKDDDLVRVDYENKENFVRLSFPDGMVKWLWISSPVRTPEEKDVGVEAMPINDATVLQPVYIEKDRGKQFWVTVRVPDDAPAGKYSGDIELWSVGNRLETLTLELTVLPFDLEPNCLESSVYYHWGIDIIEDGPGTVQHRQRTWDQYRAELENLLAHGVDNPTLGIRFSTGNLRKALQMRKDVGLKMDHLYYLIAGTWTPPEEIKEIIKIAREFGYEDVYFYGRDEVRGEKLRAQRKEWEGVHALGGKVFVAGSAGHNFPDMGDLQDLLVCYGDPTKEEAALWHSKGHKIFCYANPQSGIEEPETYRRNFGLLLAANDYDGGMTYIYYHGWNDYSGSRYRQHNFVYPSVDGVIDTVQWEGYREGIDDLRYLATLRRAVADARDAGGQRTVLAGQAQAWMDTMDVTGDLYALRREMVDWVLRLKGAGG